MKHEDVTIVLQGPLVNYWGAMSEGLAYVYDYLENVNEIIISSWSDSLDRFEPSKLEQAIKHGNISLVTDDIDKYDEYYNNSNICYQAASSLNGIREVKTKYAIKMRCDEYYTDISKFIDLMKSSPEKLTTHNFLLNPDSIEQFHPSDHMAGGYTENILGMYEKAFEWCKKFTGTDPITADQIGVQNYRNVYKDGKVSPESFLCLAFLTHMGVDINCDDSVEIMKKHVQLVPLSEMGEFLCNIKGIGHKDYEIFLESIHGKSSIGSMEEL